MAQGSAILVHSVRTGRTRSVVAKYNFGEPEMEDWQMARAFAECIQRPLALGLLLPTCKLSHLRCTTSSAAARC